MRAGQHIRVDILLRAIPPRLAYGCEWLSDTMALAGCVGLTWMGAVIAFKSHVSGALQIKSIVIPEWWVMAPVPIAFALLAIEFAFLMGGLVVTEQVFNLNGLGLLFVESVAHRDYTLTQALVLLVAFVFIFVNFLVDLAYAWLDPRIRYR